MLVITLTGIREFGEKPASDLERKLFKVIEKRCKENGVELEYSSFTGHNVNRANVLEALNAMADYLSKPNQKALLYYNGHGNWKRDKNGDEADGMDEYWELMGGGIVLDDEVSRIFEKIHDSSFLWMVCDHCSSGTMIDIKLNSRPWVQIGACQDNQDATASCDGGMFTNFGLLPALECCDTIGEVAEYISKNLEIPTQKMNVESTQPNLLDVKWWK